MRLVVDIFTGVVRPQVRSRRLTAIGNQIRGDSHEPPHDHERYNAFIQQLYSQLTRYYDTELYFLPLLTAV